MVFWGGGEYLKDYTNTASLWYWLVKTFLLKLVNSELYGVFQGIGPTEASSSRRMIAKIVNMTKRFIVRDQESYAKLMNWGADPNKISYASDPAVFLESSETHGRDIEWASVGMGASELSDFIAIAPRDWFHYRKGGFLPQRLKLSSKSHEQSSENNIYVSHLVQMIDNITGRGHKVALVPMHMSEDVEFCERVASQCKSDDISILKNDILTPKQFRYILSKAKVMIGFRLHSNIIATSNYTPSLNYYYVDKGRAYFDQIDQSENCYPIEDLLDPDFMKKFETHFYNVASNSEKIRRNLESKIKSLRCGFDHSRSQACGFTTFYQWSVLISFSVFRGMDLEIYTEGFGRCEKN